MGVETGELIAELQEEDVISGFHFSFNSVRFSPDGKWLAAAGYRTGVKTITIWETRGFTLQHIGDGLRAADGYVSNLEFSPDSRWIAGYTDRPEYKIKFWNIETKEIDFELPQVMYGRLGLVEMAGGSLQVFVVLMGILTHLGCRSGIHGHNSWLWTCLDRISG